MQDIDEYTRVSFYVQEYNPERILAEPLCSNPIDTIAEAYFQRIGDQLCRRPEANACSGVDVRDGLPLSATRASTSTHRTLVPTVDHLGTPRIPTL